MPADPEDWLAKAEFHQGSWWTDWTKWISRHGGGKVPARQPGSGGLAAIDPTTRKKVADTRLKAHPVSFQLDRMSGLIFINVPKAREIAVVDRVAGKQIASWPTSSESNFPMAVDEENQRVLVVFRRPATLEVLSKTDGRRIARVETCGDADDLFFEPKRQRIYVSCGEGFLDVFDAQAGYRRLAHIPTISGARTSLLVPELDRLFLAVRAASGEPASIWILRPEYKIYRIITSWRLTVV